MRQAAEEDTLYRGVAAPSRVQVAEEPVVTEVPKVLMIATRSAAAGAPAHLLDGERPIDCSSCASALWDVPLILTCLSPSTQQMS